MANLDADALVSVKENFLELVTKMNTPDNCKFYNIPFTTIRQVYLLLSMFKRYNYILCHKIKIIVNRLQL